jgi:serine/threonine-protein kinase
MYMAPEQFMGRAIDHRVDVYGAGVVLYQLLAGKAPFIGTHEALMYKVVNEVPVPPSTLEGAPHGPRFDEVVAKALAKDPRERFANASAFRDAVAAALGQAVPLAVAREAVYGIPMAAEYAPTERVSSPPPTNTRTTSAPPTFWDPAVLADVEQSLARHVGPLAKTMVRRAAKECMDLPSLQARLAEQITNASAREAFLGRSRGGTGSTGGSTGGSSGGTTRVGTRVTNTPPGGGTFAGAAKPVNEALMDLANKVLSAHLGPIAKVVIKRAAERTRQREPFFAILVDAVPEAAREKVMAELHKLP